MFNFLYKILKISLFLLLANYCVGQNTTVTDSLKQLIAQSFQEDTTQLELLKDLADEYYSRGDKGLRYLSFRTALTICTARTIYSEIGNVIRRKSASVTPVG